MKTFSVYYMRPDFFRDGLMGAKWLKERGKLPDPKDLEKTHIFLGSFEAADLENLFYKMQGEVWSPNGEARPIIEAKGLRHTSMSVGDIAVDQETWIVHLVDRWGFAKIGGPASIPKHWREDDDYRDYVDALDEDAKRKEGR